MADLLASFCRNNPIRARIKRLGKNHFKMTVLLLGMCKILWPLVVSKESEKSPTRGLYRLDEATGERSATVGVINLYRLPAEGLSSNYYIYGGAVSAFQI